MKKNCRWIACLSALVLALLLVLPISAASAYDVTYGVACNSATVNLRQGPSQNTTRLGYYASGTWVQIDGESGNWYHVNGPDGKSGYMSKNFVTVSTGTYQPVGIVNNQRPTAFLNLRESPSYSAKVLDYYYNGVPCLLYNLSGGWYQVQLDGVVGYFRQEYILQKTLTAGTGVATVTTPNNTGLNLRSGPGMSYGSIRQYRGGSYVMILQEGTGWWKVSTTDGYVGFMNTSFLTRGVVKPTSGTGGSTGGGSGTGSGSTGVGYGFVTNPRAGQVLNLRESASTSSRVIAQYGSGTRVTILAQGTEWCQVRVAADGYEGYMMTDYLTLYDLPATPTRTISQPQGSFVNLRSTPSMQSGSVLTRMPSGSVVTVLIPGGDWAKVRYGSYTGYAVTYFMK